MLRLNEKFNSGKTDWWHPQYLEDDDLLFNDLIDWNEKAYNDLMRLDYLFFGCFDFRNPLLSVREKSEDRLNISKNIFRVTAIELGLPAKSLSYYLKDEIAGGIDHHSGYGHTHWLLAFNGLEKKLRPYDLKKSKSIIKEKLRKVSDGWGKNSIREYDYDSFLDRGVKYTAKTQKHDKIVFSGLEYSSDRFRHEVKKKSDYNLYSSSLEIAISKRVYERENFIL
tara:strand:+ start:1599 stop:2270 length:672 start_codon:yes stop_codon:yes gene_type:complete